MDVLGRSRLGRELDRQLLKKGTALTIVYSDLEYGVPSDGNGPVCTILGGIALPNHRAVLVRMKFMARSDGLTSFVCTHISGWENDPGFTPQQLGSPTILNMRGVNAGDWNVIVEAESVDTLRFRATGTGASPVRWIFSGTIEYTCEPQYGWQADGSFIESPV